MSFLGMILFLSQNDDFRGNVRFIFKNDFNFVPKCYFQGRNLNFTSNKLRSILKNILNVIQNDNFR